jgi:hypothetical protein
MAQTQVEELLKRLDTLVQKAPRGPLTKGLVNRELTPLFDTLCLTYPEMTTEERVDTYVRFEGEGRDRFLNALAAYAGQKAGVALASLNKRDRATEALKQAIAADLIADGRADLHTTEQSQQQIMKAVEELRFELEAFADRLDLEANDFARRGMMLYKSQQRAASARALGVALHKDYKLAQTERMGELAARLTGESAAGALDMLQDRFLRETFITEQEADERRAARGGRQPRQGGGGGAGRIILLLLALAVIAAVVVGVLLLTRPA